MATDCVLYVRKCGIYGRWYPLLPYCMVTLCGNLIENAVLDQVVVKIKRVAAG